MMQIHPAWYTDPDDTYVARYWDGKRWLVALTEERLRFGKHEVALDEITAASFWSRRTTVNGMKNSVTREFVITDGDGPKKLMLGEGVRAKPDKEAAWTGLVNIYQQVIAPRMATRMLSSLLSDGVYTLGRVTLTREEIAYRGAFGRRRRCGWSAFDHARLERGYARIYQLRDGKKKSSRFARVSMRKPNAVVLPLLLAVCADEFTPS